jgi:ribosome-binding factor A
MRHRRSSAPGRRPQRVAEQVREVVTAFLQEEARDPRIGFVTVIAVDLSPDLQHAIIRYTVHGDDEARARTQEGLEAATVAVRRRIGAELRLRVVPEVVFRADLGQQHAQHIEALLAKLRDAEGQDT